MVGIPRCVSSGTSLRARTIMGPLRKPHYPNKCSNVRDSPCKPLLSVVLQNDEKDLWTSSLLSFSRLFHMFLQWETLGIHQSLTFHKFKWIEKIGEARTYCLPLDSTQNRKIVSLRSLVFLLIVFSSSLSTIVNTQRPPS